MKYKPKVKNHNFNIYINMRKRIFFENNITRMFFIIMTIVVTPLKAVVVEIVDTSQFGITRAFYEIFHNGGGTYKIIINIIDFPNNYSISSQTTEITTEGVQGYISSSSYI